jgi:hypothetical protein
MKSPVCYRHTVTNTWYTHPSFLHHFIASPSKSSISINFSGSNELGKGRSGLAWKDGGLFTPDPIAEYPWFGGLMARVPWYELNGGLNGGFDHGKGRTE